MIPELKLNNGLYLPQIGFGLMNCKTQETMDAAVSAAIDSGCRMFDGAFLYGNEALFGNALKKKLEEAGLKREEVFVGSKIRTSMHPYDKVRPALEAQLKELQLDYLDFYLIHWPMPGNGQFLECWRAFEDLCDEGLIRIPGVCNCFEPQLQRILDMCRIIPQIDQIQTNPYYVNQNAIRFCEEHGIQVMAWSPLRHGTVLQDPVLLRLAEKYHKTTAQITLRWLVQLGYMPIPGSSNPERVRESFGIFDFALDKEDMKKIDALERNDPGHGRVPNYDPECMDHLF